MPAGYVIVDVHTTDAEKMAQYRVWSTKAMQEYGAEILVRGGTFDVLEGPWTPERIVLLKFASREQARAWYHSETYTHARTLREGAGVVSMVAVDGAE